VRIPSFAESSLRYFRRPQIYRMRPITPEAPCCGLASGCNELPACSKVKSSREFPKADVGWLTGSTTAAAEKTEVRGGKPTPPDAGMMAS
jgi:hypothetical protein